MSQLALAPIDSDSCGVAGGHGLNHRSEQLWAVPLRAIGKHLFQEANGLLDLFSYQGLGGIDPSLLRLRQGLNHLNILFYSYEDLAV